MNPEDKHRPEIGYADDPFEPSEELQKIMRHNSRSLEELMNRRKDEPDVASDTREEAS